MTDNIKSPFWPEMEFYGGDPKKVDPALLLNIHPLQLEIAKELIGAKGMLIVALKDPSRVDCPVSIAMNSLDREHLRKVVDLITQLINKQDLWKDQK